MSLQAFKEPVANASRCRFIPASPSRKRPSKVLAALDAHMMSTSSAHWTGTSTKAEEDCDSSVEIIGPIRFVKTRDPAKKPLHPLFKPGTSVSDTIMLSKSTPGISAEVLKTTSATTTKRSTTKGSTIATKTKTKDSSEPALPNYSYREFKPRPTPVFTRHEEETNDLVQTLRGPIGFDMEWRVMYNFAGPERRTALIQLSDDNIILLVQISAMNRFPEKLRELIESEDVLKVGANILNDGLKLFRDFGIRAAGLVELGAVALQADPKFDFYTRPSKNTAAENDTASTNTVSSVPHKRSVVALAKLVARYAGRNLVKGKERTSNWEGKLNEPMLAYAANDAHCALTVYNNLLKIAQDNGRVLLASEYTRTVPMPPPTTTIPPPALDAPPRPQQMRAYSLWYRRNEPLESICELLRSKEDPLKESTVISYVVEALKADPTLPFELEKLWRLVQMEAGSWQRHRDWILTTEASRRGGLT